MHDFHELYCKKVAMQSYWPLHLLFFSVNMQHTFYSKVLRINQFLLPNQMKLLYTVTSATTSSKSDLE